MTGEGLALLFESRLLQPERMKFPCAGVDYWGGSRRFPGVGMAFRWAGMLFRGAGMACLCVGMAF